MWLDRAISSRSNDFDGSIVRHQSIHLVLGGWKGYISKRSRASTYCCGSLEKETTCRVGGGSDITKKSLHPHLDAKMLVSPLYPKMNLTRVLPNACTVFKSALRPMLMRFEVKLASTFSLHDLLGDDAVVLHGTIVSRPGYVIVLYHSLNRYNLLHPIHKHNFLKHRYANAFQLVHSKPSNWIVQDLKSAMSKRTDSSTMIEVDRRRWIAMIDAVCARIVMTYIIGISGHRKSLDSKTKSCSCKGAAHR